jgi:hypothetical protein
MHFDNGAFDATLAAAAGEDAALLSELRDAFAEGVARQLDLLRRSRCDGNWTMAAMRLRGLATSFHAVELITISDELLTSAPGEPVVLRRLQNYLTEFTIDS